MLVIPLCLLRLSSEFCLRAYSAAAVVESMHGLKNPSDVHSLSPQQIIDCSFAYENALYGCRGGNPCSALQWMKMVCYDEHVFAI
jgi:hypothetical protein